MLKNFAYFVVYIWFLLTIHILKIKADDFQAYAEIEQTISVQQVEFLNDIFFTGDGDLKLVLDETNTKYVIQGLPGFYVNVLVSENANFEDTNATTEQTDGNKEETTGTKINPENKGVILDPKTGEAIINLTGEIAISEDNQENVQKSVFIAINY